MVNTDLLPTNSSTESIPCISCGAYSTLVDEEGICAACVLHSYSKVWTNSSDTNPTNIENENPFDPEQRLALSQWQSIPTTITPLACIAASTYPTLDAVTVRRPRLESIRRLASTQSSHKMKCICPERCYCEFRRRYLGKDELVLEEGYPVDDDNDNVEQKSHVDPANLLV